jgi:hypothetical protein
MSLDAVQVISTSFLKRILAERLLGMDDTTPPSSAPVPPPQAMSNNMITVNMGIAANTFRFNIMALPSSKR